jgi:isocitrate dehydrogenase
MSKYFEKTAKSLEENEEKIIEELMTIQGKEVDLGGYYHTDPIKVRKIMRPSETFNQIIP